MAKACGKFKNLTERRRFIMKNILIIQGGGRPKGNTAQLVGSFAKGAGEAGHKVKVISLIKNEVRGCLGCNACRYGKPCVQKDAFNDIVPEIKEHREILLYRRRRFGAAERKIREVPYQRLRSSYDVGRRFIPDFRTGRFLLSICPRKLHRL